MATLLSHTPHLVLSPYPEPSRAPNSNHLFRPTHSRFPHGLFPHRRPLLRGSRGVVRAGFYPGSFPDLDYAEGAVRELVGRAESVLYTIADAAVSSSETVTTAKQSSDWFSGIAGTMESVLKVLKDGLSALHVPYSYGFAIILLTVIVKAATFPLTKKQVESAMAMRSLTPQIRAIQEQYAGDQERIQLETARLYKLAGINPLAGCLPTLATIPVWIGLYRALSNVADEGLLTEGFFWIPSLSGPTTVAARQSGSGISWLFPFVDGHPPLGWSDTLAYLVLPVLLIVSQYISVQIMQSSQGNDPNLKNSQALTKFVPLLIGYFALSVPSGLSLYWLTNNVLSTAQQVWLQKLGGAKNSALQLSDIIKEQQKSQFEANLTQKNVKQAEKLTPEGLRPGERFKRIKEQEARRRQQREEEERKAVEAAANKIQISNQGDKEESNSIETENGGIAKLVDVRSVRVPCVTTNEHSDERVVNGELSTLDSNCEYSDERVVYGGLSSRDSIEDQKEMRVLRIKNGEISSNDEVDGRHGQHPHENLEQDEAVEAYTSTDRKFSGEDLPRAKQEVAAEKHE